MNITFQEVLQNLLPTSGSLLYDIFLYPIFFLSLIVLFMQSDKQLTPTLMMAATLLLVVLAKLTINANQPFRRADIGMLFVNIAIFVLPALVAALSKAKRSRPLAIFAFVLGAVYTALYWLTFQR